MNKINVAIEGTDEQVTAALQALMCMVQELKDQGHEFQVKDYMIQNEESWITVCGKGS